MQIKGTYASISCTDMRIQHTCMHNTINYHHLGGNQKNLAIHALNVHHDCVYRFGSQCQCASKEDVNRVCP